MALGFATCCAVQVLGGTPILDQEVADFAPHVYEAAKLFPEPPPEDLTYWWLTQTVGNRGALPHLSPEDFTSTDLSALLSIAAGAIRRDQWNDSSIQKFFDIARDIYEKAP